MPATPASDLLTTAELAQRWRVTPKTVRERVHFHGMPVYRIGTAMRFDLAECEAWLRSRPSQQVQVSDTAPQQWIAEVVSRFSPDDLRRAAEIFRSLADAQSASA